MIQFARFIILGFFLYICPVIHAQNMEMQEVPKTIPELREAILQILEDTNTPAVGIVIVDKEGPVWIEGLGQANIAENIDANVETMFRIGSTSKIFVALAVLKLQEQGKLNLKDEVKEIIPEIKFKNSWEDSNPVLIEHLLEHTTGWDDLHLVEHDQKGPQMVSLKEALEFHPHSRESRWVPGTRMAYSNTGPNVAAYIVEKITGKPYEVYIKENFFDTMGMETMTYFLSEDYKQKGATLYTGEPQDYWHSLMRASGSINASPKDMARMVQFFVNRGMIDSTRLISENSLRRMETPSSTLGAKAGLEYGYGLGLYSSPHKDFIYYKHGGGLSGGISDFSYLPEYGVGYSLMLNSGNSDAIYKLSKLIRDFQIQKLQTPKIISNKIEGNVFSYSGYFQPINLQSTPLNLPNLTARRIWTGNDTLYTQYLAYMGEVNKYLPVGDNLFKSVKTGRVEIALVEDPIAGNVFELANVGNGTLTFGKIPGIVFFGRIMILVLWILFIIRAFLLLPIWAIRYWMGKIRGGANVWIRIWPLIPIIFLILAMMLFAGGTMDGLEPLATPSAISISIMISTILFFITAILSLVMAVKYKRNNLKRSVYIPAAIFSGLQMLVALFLFYHGLIGIMTWA